jgi:hypothetical protein
MDVFITPLKVAAGKPTRYFFNTLSYCVHYAEKSADNWSEPIRDRKKITQDKNLLRGQHRYRDFLLFVVGINTALRISDLLELQVEQTIKLSNDDL